MKVLWIVNTIFPFPSEKIGITKTSFGGWLNSLAEEISKKENIKLSIAALYSGKEILEFFDGRIFYYLIPGFPGIKYNKRTEKFWTIINNKFQPDLVHIHGTEFAHGLAFVNACPNVKVVTSIQGLVSVISKVYYANMDFFEIFKNITFRDIVRNDTIFHQKREFEKRGINELKIICNSDAVIGRTDWDYANCKAIDNKINYYFCNENLRSSFYKNKWCIDNVKRNTIFCSQASYPLKGLHHVIRALYILKHNYKDAKLIVAGYNILDDKSLLNRIKRSGYGKYISRLIRKLDLEDSIEFTGILSEGQMVKKMLESNVFVLASSVENGSNSLGEAMLMSMPCVAANTGGSNSMLTHKKEGFLYPYTEPAMLAEYIYQVFSNDELANSFGKNARKKAISRHNRDRNCERTIEIYKQIIENKRK